MEQLRDKIAQFDFEIKDAGRAEEIRTLLQQLLAKHPQLTPPLDIYTYTLRSLLYPVFSIDRIPDLLDLVAMVEFSRLSATERVTEALVWNDYYKNGQDGSRDPGKPILRAGEEHYFDHIQGSGDEARAIFVQIVSECCVADIHKLWVGSSNTEFLTRWNDYFPVSAVGKTKSKQSFHYNLHEAELKVLHDASLLSYQYMQETVLWAEDNRSEKQTITEVFNTPAFRCRFPNPVDLQALGNLIEYHVKYVEELVARVNVGFEPLDTDST